VVRDVRAVLGRARGNVHLQKSYRRTRPSGASRTAGERGSSRCSRTSMNTCGESSAGQRSRAPPGPLARAAHVGPARRKAPRLQTRSATLTCAGWNGATRLENRALCVPFQAPREVSEGRFRRSFRELTRLRSSSTRAPHERGDRTARSRQRAVKHEAAGGRMTARWSGAVPGCKVATPRPERPRSRTPAGLPTAPGRESPETTLLNKRVLVTRNVGCRSGFEAS